MFFKKLFKDIQKEESDKSVEERFCDSKCNINKANETIDRIEAVLNGDETWFLSLNKGVPHE